MRVEVNMVAKSAKEAAKYYEKLFNAITKMETDHEGQLNEVVLEVGGTDIRILDENPDFGLVAPTDESIASTWLSVYVEDIYQLNEVCHEQNCQIISPITEFNEGRAINLVFKDVFNHVWVINQIIK